MRTLAIDLGSRRVGFALSDQAGKWATPLSVIEVNSPAHAIEAALKIIAREEVERIVVGLPLNMGGTIGPAAKQTIKWARKLAGQSGKPVLCVDERLSSFDAEQALNQRKRAGEKLTRKKKKQQLDALAAAGFLQEFLDERLAPISIEPSGDAS